MELELPAPVFSQSFHPSKNLYAVGCVGGLVRVYSYSNAENPETYKVRYEKQEEHACRVVLFSEEYLLYGLGECECVCLSVEGFVEALRTEPRDGVGVSALLWLSPTLFCIGCDDGLIQIYDRTYEKSLRAEIREFEYSINDLALHPDGDKFYAISSAQLGLFNIASKDHGTRLLAMSDVASTEFEKFALMEHGKKIVCCCDDMGLAIYHDSNIGTHKDRISGVKYCLFSILKLSEEFFLTAGETGQVLVGQLSPNQFIGLFDELTNLHHHDEEMSCDSQESSFVVDSMALDREQKVVTFVENINTSILFRSAKTAFDICEGAQAGRKSNYANFMEDL